MKRSQQKGFTLIELVIVIVIVGILAIVALPKFINMGRDARVAKAQAVFGSVKTAAALAKSRCELDLGQGLNAAGTCGNAAPQVNMMASSSISSIAIPPPRLPVSLQQQES